jgi:hypothetical protein
MHEELLETIEDRYQEIEKAFHDKDLEAVASHIAPGWTGEAKGERVTREQLLGNVRNQFETLDDISWPRTITLISATDTEAVVKAVGDYCATKADTGEPFEMHLANQDTWTLGPGGWQVSGSLALD